MRLRSVFAGLGVALMSFAATALLFSTANALFIEDSNPGAAYGLGYGVTAVLGVGGWMLWDGLTE
jgi:hypothetical protein